MTIYIASDHAGFVLKELVVTYLSENGYNVINMGTSSAANPVDYPDFAHAVVRALDTDREAYGILICGTGIGMSIAANRFPHIRATLCQTEQEAMLARQHNNANIICLGARIIDAEQAFLCVKQFMTTDFDGGRHQNRLDKIKNNIQI